MGIRLALGGLWHGFIAPFDLLAAIWNDVTVYAQNTNGHGTRSAFSWQRWLGFLEAEEFPGDALKAITLKKEVS